MSLLDRIADLYTDPVLGIWGILSLPATALLFLIFYPDPISSFYLFLLLLTLAWLVVAPIAFEDTAHASIDWNEVVDYKKVVAYTSAGIAGLLLIGLFLSTLLLGKITPAIWVPSQLFPLSLSISGSTLLLTNLFSTTFSVVPGEESLKALFAALFRAYQNRRWADRLPFALQPAITTGVTMWALEHVVKGQYPIVFAVTVFLSGLVMKSCAALSGTYLTSWLIHLGYNSVILTSSFMVIT